MLLMQRRMLIKQLMDNGFWSDGGTKHEKFTNGRYTVLVKRHQEIPDQIAKRIMREAGLR